MRDDDHTVIGIVARVHAMWRSNKRQQHDKCRGDVRASLAESMEHRNTTVPVRLRDCQVHARWYASPVLIMMAAGAVAVAARKRAGLKARPYRSIGRDRPSGRSEYRADPNLT